MVVSSLEPVAVLTHDYTAASPLRSWSPAPAEHLHGGELLALRAFGSLLDGIRSPRHPYFASWRDPDPSSLRAEERDSPPTSVLFGARFSTAPHEMPRALTEAADMFNRLDRAELRLDLVRDENGCFELHRLEVELNNPSSREARHFRSCWQGAEIRSLDLSLHFDPPASRLAPFRFHLQGRLARRYNQGALIEREHVQLTASGGAMPLPPWVNY